MDDRGGYEWGKQENKKEGRTRVLVHALDRVHGLLRFEQSFVNLFDVWNFCYIKSEASSVLH